MRCCYNTVNFPTNIPKRHPIAHLLGRGMGCGLGIQHLIDILPQSLQLFMQYLTILDRVLMALDCILVEFWSKVISIWMSYSCLNTWILVRQIPWDHFNIKMLSDQCKNSHYKNKTVLWLAHLHNGNNYTLKDSLYIETGPWFCWNVEIHLVIVASLYDIL